MAMRIGCVASTGNAICKASTNSSEDKDALVAALLLHLKRLGAAYKLVPDQPNAPAALPVDLISSSLTVGHTLDSAQRHSRVSQTDQNFILFRRGQFHSSSTDPYRPVASSWPRGLSLFAFMHMQVVHPHNALDSTLLIPYQETVLLWDKRVKQTALSVPLLLTNAKANPIGNTDPLFPPILASVYDKKQAEAQNAWALSYNQAYAAFGLLCAGDLAHLSRFLQNLIFHSANQHRLVLLDRARVWYHNEKNKDLCIPEGAFLTSSIAASLSNALKQTTSILPFRSEGGVAALTGPSSLSVSSSSSLASLTHPSSSAPSSVGLPNAAHTDRNLTEAIRAVIRADARPRQRFRGQGQRNYQRGGAPPAQRGEPSVRRGKNAYPPRGGK